MSAKSTRIAEVGYGLGMHSRWLLETLDEIEHARTLTVGSLYSADDLREMEKRDKAHLRWCQRLVLDGAREIAAILNKTAPNGTVCSSPAQLHTREHSRGKEEADG